MEQYKITEYNDGLISQLLYLEEVIDGGEVRDLDGVFYEKYFPYTIQEVVGLLVQYDFRTGEQWEEFKQWYHENSFTENLYKKKEGRK